jgi:hypothetical protein
MLGQAYTKEEHLAKANQALTMGMQKAVFSDDEKLVIQYLKAMVKLGEEMFVKNDKDGSSKAQLSLTG